MPGYTSILKLLWGIDKNLTNDINSDEENLCILGKFDYDAGSVDYDKKPIQRLYLLRYLPAFLHQYEFIYRKILRSDWLEGPLNVLSLGAGWMIDYLGLCSAIVNPTAINASWSAHDKLALWMAEEHVPRLSRDIEYLGVDKVKWADIIDPLHGITRQTAFMDIADLHTRFNLGDYNLIIFPKSIRDFDYKAQNALCECLNQTSFEHNRIMMVSSWIGKDDQNIEDTGPFERMVRATDYRVNARASEQLNNPDSSDRNIGFRSRDGIVSIESNLQDFFKYPDSIIDHVKRLPKRFAIITDRLCATCSKQEYCWGNITRHPTSRDGRFAYSILPLERA